MNRTAATSYLAEEYRELATDAKFTSDQTAVAYSTAIDMSLRQLGIVEANLPTADVVQADVLKYLACLNYYALARFSKLLSIRFDVKAGSGAIDASRSQAFEAVKSLMGQAAMELSQYGINVGGVASFQMGRVNLDFLEPSTLGEF